MQNQSLIPPNNPRATAYALALLLYKIQPRDGVKLAPSGGSDLRQKSNQWREENRKADEGAERSGALEGARGIVTPAREAVHLTSARELGTITFGLCRWGRTLFL